jgi:hypothetical protein
VKIFTSIDKKSVTEMQNSQLQYDYFAAYLDFYIGYPNFTIARDICDKYLDYPVVSWRNLF